MKRLSLVLAVIATTLALSGCVVADGVAHLVKLGQGAQGKTASAPAAASPAAQPAAATADEAPPPPPAPRDTIRVEELSPPHS